MAVSRLLSMALAVGHWLGTSDSETTNLLLHRLA
jgi:hypothetical protein